MERTAENVDDWLAAQSGPRADDLRVLDGRISAEFDGLERVIWAGTMWGGTEQTIIGYGAISQPRPRGASVEWFLVGLAVQKRHLSVYVNAAEGREYLVQQRAGELGRVKVGAAAVTFGAVTDLDLDAFGAMLRRARELTPDAR